MDVVNLEWRRQFATCRQARVAVLGAVAALSVSFALFLGWFAGGWMILPFAGLEIVCVAVAFWWLELAATDCDCIEVTETRVKIVRCRRQASQQFEFNRGWLSTELKRDQMGGLHGVRLLQSGRCVELLEFLPVSEQHRALRELRAALSKRQLTMGLNFGVWVVRNKIELNTMVNQFVRSAGSSVATLGTSTAAVVVGLMPISASADWKMNLPPPNSAVAQQMFDLHTMVTVLCVVIFFAVFGVMFYSLYAHRKSKGHKAAQFHESATVEAIWTIIPFFILLAMAFPATKAVLDMRDASAPEMTIKVTGYQWKWGYDYIHDGFGYVSTLSTPLAQIKNSETKGENYLLEVDNPLVVPVGRKVRVLITANDVLHAWWVPALGVKQDAIPGFIRDAWFRADRPGIYRGNCAELCGKEHGFMPVVVEVKTQADYDKWLAAQKDKYGVGKAANTALAIDMKTYGREELVAHGKTVYEGVGGCQGCHQPTGKGIAGQFPALDGSKVVNGPKLDQVALLLNGKAGTAMASFKHLSDKDLAGVVAYTRSSWSNKAAEFVQPVDFAKARNGGVLPAGAVTMDAAEPAAPGTASTTVPTSAVALPARLYFAAGKKELPGDARQSIDAALAFLRGKSSAKLDITGYTDQTGDRAANLELAKERAKAVRAALEAAGVSRDQIIMKPPAEVTGGGDNKEARRVEINAGA